MNTYNEMQDDEIEIDLKALIVVLWKKAWVILLAAFVLGTSAFGVTKLFITPQYTASSMIYILSKSTSMTSLADIQLSAQLTADYEVMAVSRPVVEAVKETFALEETYEEIVEQFITIENPSDSHILRITIEHPDPQMAADIANEMADEVAERVANVMATDKPNTVEWAVVPEGPSSPNTLKNTLIGILAGMFLSAGIFTVLFILDDTIKDEEDVEKYLGKSVLATLPKEGKNRKEIKKDPPKRVARNTAASKEEGKE